MGILTISNLSKNYNSDMNPVKALDCVNASIEKGEFIGIMGPSGSGKTTLLNMLSGVDKPTSGRITIGDNDIQSLSDEEMAIFRRRRLGFVFQEFNLLDSLTLKENMILPMILDKKKSVEMDAKSKEILKLLEINSIANKYPYQVSGGQQQRAAIGRALVNEPDILFADEPTGNLDSKSANSIMTYFEKINKEKKCTILLVTHDPFAASFCTRIIFIKDGKVHSELNKTSDRKGHFDKILDHISSIDEGERKNDI